MVEERWWVLIQTLSRRRRQEEKEDEGSVVDEQWWVSIEISFEPSSVTEKMARRERSRRIGGGGAMVGFERDQF